MAELSRLLIAKIRFFLIAARELPVKGFSLSGKSISHPRITEKFLGIGNSRQKAEVCVNR